MLPMILLVIFISLNVSKAGEQSLYDFLWLDPDKSVYVLQNKIYKKERNFYANIGYLENYTSKFQDTNGISLQGGYYFREDWGIELFFNQYSNKDNDDLENIRLVNESEPFVRRMKKSYGGLLIWSPFYGKINTFNKIFYFDWSFGAGLGEVQTESNLKSVTNERKSNTFKRESQLGGIAKTKLKFHLNENVHLGLEYMNTYYKAPGPKAPSQDKLRTNTDVIFSVGFSF